MRGTNCAKLTYLYIDSVLNSYVRSGSFFKAFFVIFRKIQIKKPCFDLWSYPIQDGGEEPKSPPLPVFPL